MAPVSTPDVTVNRALGEIRLAGGGGIDFWSIDVTGRAARGRKYHLCLCDESAHDGGYPKDTLEAAIAPATIDYRGKIVLASPAGPRGVGDDSRRARFVSSIKLTLRLRRWLASARKPNLFLP
jgi:hypothetical protein